jgi:hypothetical protein
MTCSRRPTWPTAIAIIRQESKGIAAMVDNTGPDVTGRLRKLLTD